MTTEAHEDFFAFDRGDKITADRRTTGNTPLTLIQLRVPKNWRLGLLVIATGVYDSGASFRVEGRVVAHRTTGDAVIDTSTLAAPLSVAVVAGQDPAVHDVLGFTVTGEPGTNIKWHVTTEITIADGH